MTHTEGPWSVIHHDEWRNLPSWEQPSTVCHAGDYVIVTDGPSYEFHGPDEADALLIAAAPDLLAALLTASCPFGGWNGMPDRLEGICTVADCIKDGSCGCSLGDAARKASPALASPETPGAA